MRLLNDRCCKVRKLGRRQQDLAAIDPDSLIEACREVGRRLIPSPRPAAQAMHSKRDRKLVDEAISAEFQD